jgi:Pectate lyase superfamily protein
MGKAMWLIVMLATAVLVVLWGCGGLHPVLSNFPGVSPVLQPISQSSIASGEGIAQLPPSQSIPIPEDASYVNVKNWGAKGDGVTDDTAVLNNILGRNKEEPGGAIRSIYFPNGTYLVSDTLAWGDKRKDVRGESRDGVMIKLQDHCSGFQDASHPRKVLQVEFGHGGQNFNQRLRNLTVDVGEGNPGAIGIGFHTNNGGGVYDVVVRSSDPEQQGHIGLSLDMAWPGPGLIKNVQIDGFDTGIFIGHDQYSMTFEHILLTNQRQVGFVNDWNSVAIRDLKSVNQVPAVENRGAMALMALIEAELVGGDRTIPAISNHSDGVLFARDIKTQGYQVAIDNQSGQPKEVAGPNIAEFTSHGVSSLFPSSSQSLHLPIEDPPEIPLGNVSDWVSITRFGAQPNDEQDDGIAIQKAIDSGAKTIYFPSGVYQSQQSIRVRGKTERIIGFNAAFTLTTPNQPAFILENGVSPAVAIEIDTTYESQHNYWIQHASKRTLFLKGGSYINTVSGGKVFIEDTTAVPFVFNQQQVWIRQINPESYDHNPYINNNGSDVWILGLKTEKDRTVIRTYNNGRTEVLGGLLYKNRERVGPAPAFISEDAAVSLVYRNKGESYQTQVLETRHGVIKEFKVQDMPASNWRMPLFVGYQ